MFHNCFGLRTAVSSFVFLCLLSSCTPTTGTKVVVDRSSLTRLQQMGATVTKDEEFSVRLAREQTTSMGAAFGGLIGAGIEAAARSNTDTQYAEQLKPVLGTYDPARLLTEELLKNLQREHVFYTVVSLPAEDKNVVQGRRLDGVLAITLKQWGLRLCRSPTTEEKVQAGLQVAGHITSAEKGEIVWERHELYLDGECRTLEELRSQEGLLVNALSRAIDHLSGKIVNEIRFP